MIAIRNAKIVAIMMVAILGLASCRETTSESERPSAWSIQTSDRAGSCKVATHAWGETELCQTPQRIIALDSQSLDLLLTLGIDPIGYAEDNRALVGSPQLGKPVEAVKYLGQYLKQPPLHVGTWQTPSQETMLKLKPDLILSTSLDEGQYRLFSKIAPTLLPITSWDNPQQWKENLAFLATVMARPEIADSFLKNHAAKVKRIKAQLAESSDQRILLLSMSGLDRIDIFTNKTFPGSILTELGLDLIVPERAIAGDGAIPISLETLPQLKPDRIIVMASGKSKVEQLQALWASNPILKSLPSYRAQKMQVVDYHLWNRIQGPKSAELILSQVKDWMLPQ
ncbi:MAG TPA: iron-siderophore ABC transporter substrate-binding protein [Stenomitos sp.]